MIAGAPFRYYRFNVSANTSVSYSIETVVRFTLFTVGPNAATQGVWFGATSSTGVLTASKLSPSSSYGITVSVANGKLTVKNDTNAYVGIAVIMLSGTITV